MNITVDDLIYLIGQKEAELAVLRQQVKQLLVRIAELEKPVEVVDKD